MSFRYKGQRIPTGGGGPSYSAGDGVEITETEAGPAIGVTTPVQGVVTQAEYDALPEERRNRGLYVISDGGSAGSGGSSGEVYSTEETRIGTWIDGKPLYKKIVVVNSAITGNKDIVNVSDLSISEFISIRPVFCCEESSGLYYRCSSDHNVICAGSKNKQTIRWYQVGISNTYLFYIIIKYTKTSDEGGSI